MIRSLYSVIVNWNLREDTLTCIASLFAAGAKSGKVIVVDNGSTDGSIEALRTRFDTSVKLIESKQNLGFAGGLNLGLKFALERHANWILVLNNDTYVAPTFLIEFENALHSHEDVSIWGPVIRYHDEPNRISYFGDRRIAGSLATRSLYREQIDCKDFPPVVPVDFVSGCCMMIKRDVFDAIGLFDDGYFMYGEDVDFCWRARLAGFRFAVSARAKMWHRISTSSNLDQPKFRYLRIRNQIRVYRTYSRGLQLVLMLGFTWLRALGIAFDDLIHRRIALIGPLAQGWVHGWFR